MWGLVDFPNLCISQTSNWALVDGKTRWRGGSPVRGDGAWARRPDRVCVCVCVCVEPSRHLQPAGGVEQKQ